MNTSSTSGIYLQTGNPLSRGPTVLTKPSFSRSATVIIQEVAKASRVEPRDDPEESKTIQDELSKPANVHEQSDECDSPQIVSGPQVILYPRHVGSTLTTPTIPGFPVHRKSVHSQSPVSDVKTETDLEIVSPSPILLSEPELYQQTCARLKLIPMSVVTSSLSTETLDIKGRTLSTNDVLALCRALLDNITIRVLRLDLNGITDQSVRYIALMLQENRHIHTLSLAENQIGNKGAADLVEALIQTKILTSCNLTGNNFGDAEALLFAKAIKENQSLKVLNLSHNHFGDKSCQLLGAALGDNEHLQTLDVSWNKIRPVGSVYIYRGLAMNVCLHTLNLAMNGCSNDGAKVLAQALSANQSLTYIDVSSNRIYNTGAAAIAKSLKVNDNLKVLKNPVSAAGVMGLLAAINANKESKIELLDVASVPVHKEALDLRDTIRDKTDRDFRFLYCRLLRSKRECEVNDEKLDPRSPMILLKDYVSKRGLRLVDLFKLFDSDNSGSVSREEFIDGLKKIEVPFSSGQLESLMDMLDTDGDGEVDYEELLLGDKQIRRKLALLAEAKREKARKK